MHLVNLTKIFLHFIFQKKGKKKKILYLAGSFDILCLLDLQQIQFYDSQIFMIFI